MLYLAVRGKMPATNRPDSAVNDLADSSDVEHTGLAFGQVEMCQCYSNSVWWESFAIFVDIN